jgi:selenocysteine-specific elongation factor
MRVVATAGHVDHGKSTLVRALTGINPDRLREEQQRGMTIDLGFAWLTLPDGEPVGIVDVPGHADFIENMLAGVGGVDAALLVVAADEGLMPQTLEHLAILSLLRIQTGLVALTKADLVADEAWIALVSDDVRRALASTPLAEAPLVAVSAKTGQGLDALTATLAQVLARAPARRDLGRPRLPVDRVFVLPGFGTVVTGTLSDGVFAVGDEVEVHTQRGERLTARIRGMQMHKQKIARAQLGSRLAMNLAGVEAAQIARGSVVARPGAYALTTLADVYLEVLDEARQRGFGLQRVVSLRHRATVKVFSGAAHSMAQVRLLEGDVLFPGATGWAQLQFASPMLLAAGDRFIVRWPSPALTVAGGLVVDPHPSRLHRRRRGHADPAVLLRLSALHDGSPADKLLQAISVLAVATLDELKARVELDDAGLRAALDELSARGAIVVAHDLRGTASVVWGAEALGSVHQRAVALLRAFHTTHPLAEGMPREALRSQLKLSPLAFEALLKRYSDPDALDGMVESGGLVRLASHALRFTPQQEAAIEDFLARCRACPWATPSVKEARAALGDQVYEVLLRRGQIMQLNAEVILLPETYAQALQDMRVLVARRGQVTVAEVRDHFATTRKYALALMEYLDAQGITQRVGDARVLRAIDGQNEGASA